MAEFAVKEGSVRAPTARRDYLRNIELEVQRKWSDEKIYERQRRVDSEGNELPKYMVTFPYPYMNGRFHLGHAFTLTKAEFTARFQRLLGKNVLFPFGFHCTGMPIQAAANKLRDEIATYGCPPVFPETTVEPVAEEKSEEKSAEATIAAKGKGKKSKLIAKGMTKSVRQWDILAKMVPPEEIPAFADPIKWLEYFPPYGASDLQAFGSCIDWRRSFITTSVNSFYDAFIRWQFNHLRAGNKIKFGKRAGVFSVLDGQVCADHDRASGEGVGPQEYTIIKLKVLEPYPEGSPLSVLSGRQVFLAPATLRPETMYGQTNCFVLPEGDYGAFETINDDILIISHRAAKGMSYQGILKEWGRWPSLVDVKGSDLIGLPLKAPNAVYERVYTLPLLTISMGKGTGVVTSVPSDAPDDYAALRELKQKPLFREKFGLTAEMVEPFEVIPIIEIEGYGNTSAVFMCEKLGIQSYKDTDKLKAAKDEVYLKGFYEGIMIVGECTGMRVCDAKPIIRKTLIDRGDALSYFEPESTVMSRSGDECIVALTDQWYLSYGDPEWQKIVSDHIHSSDCNMFNDKIMEQFDFVLGWLKEWACSRQFGLGTQLPWDQQWVIESLSDSTVYMAYYTIAHYFHGTIDNMSGPSSPSGISADQLTDEVFDFIFLRGAAPSTSIPSALLEEMRAEFEYWYPMDLRVSAKDLIQNHLTMCLYNHVEIWKDRPELWPKGIFCNGHIMVDAEKMSKSKGNFIMMIDCCEGFFKIKKTLHEPKRILVLQFIQAQIDPANGTLPADINDRVKAFVEGEADLKKGGKAVIEFSTTILAEFKKKGPEVLVWEKEEEFALCTDATRFALADAGDTLEDANFDTSVANNAVSYLFVEEGWIRSTIADVARGALREGGELAFMDRVFLNEIDYLVETTQSDFEKMNYKNGLRHCWYEMMIMRDMYRDWSKLCDIPPHKDVIMRFIEVLVVSMAPICPHWSEHLWAVLGHTGTVCDAQWPTFAPHDKLLRKQLSFYRDFLDNLRQAAFNPKAKLTGPKSATVYIASVFEAKKIAVLTFLQGLCSEAGEFPEDLLKQMKTFVEADPELKKDTKGLMQFGAFMRDEAKQRGPDALAVEQPFDQMALLQENAAHIQKSVDLVGLEIYDIGQPGIPGDKKKYDAAMPGKPIFFFFASA